MRGGERGEPTQQQQQTMPKSDLTAAGTRHTKTAAAAVDTAIRCYHSLYFIDVTRDTFQASMAPCVEPASQSAPVPDPQGPFLPV